MSPENVEQAMDELTKRVERLEVTPNRHECQWCGRPMEPMRCSYKGRVWQCFNKACQFGWRSDLASLDSPRDT